MSTDCTCQPGQPWSVDCPVHHKAARLAQPPPLVPEAPSVSDQASDRKSHWGRLESAGRRNALIRQLARGERTVRQLAAIHQVAHSSIVEFAQRHKDEIEARKQEDYRALDDTWIAHKEDRLMQLESLYSKLEHNEVEPDVVRAAKDLLRAAAEELGQIPNKTTVVQAQPVEIILREEGVTQAEVDKARCLCDPDLVNPECPVHSGGEDYEQGL